MKLTYRDKEHAYWLDGKRCRGISTVAGYPDNKYGIEQWTKRMIVIGCASSPPLMHRAAAHFDERDMIQDIAEEALNLAKANEKSGRGTADHRLTERYDLGLDFIDTPEARAIHTAWASALDRAGLEVIPDYIERIVVYADQLVAGRLDRICRRRSDDRLVIVDVKTGENAIKYPHSPCIQLGLYANAPLIAASLQKTRDGVEWTDRFDPMPDLDLEVGYVVHLPPEGPGRVFPLDIAAGFEAAQQICFPTITWQKRSDLIGPEIDVQVTATPTALTSHDRLTWLRRRIHAIVDTGHETELANIWDLDHAPTPIRTDTPLTDEQVDTIAGWCAQIEGAHQLPFEATDPLFAPFVPVELIEADTKDAVTEIENLGKAADEIAAHWAERARELLIEYYDLDEPMINAVVEAAFMTGAEPMNETLFHRIEALAGQGTNLDGAVLFAFDDTGVHIAPAPDAEEWMIAAAGGSRSEARDRAARIAKSMGRIAPRSLSKAAETPLYAAMVAAGHGTPTTTNKEQQQP